MSLTQEFYRRIREVADEHDGRLDVTIEDGLPVPVVAHPRSSSRLAPQLFISSADMVAFRQKIATEGLLRRR